MRVIDCWNKILEEVVDSLSYSKDSSLYLEENKKYFI